MTWDPARKGEETVSKRTELLFTRVRNNYRICITVGLDDNFSLKTASATEKALTGRKCGTSLLFFNPYKVERDLLERGVWALIWKIGATNESHLKMLLWSHFLCMQWVLSYVKPGRHLTFWVQGESILSFNSIMSTLWVWFLIPTTP